MGYSDERVLRMKKWSMSGGVIVLACLLAGCSHSDPRIARSLKVARNNLHDGSLYDEAESQEVLKYLTRKQHVSNNPHCLSATAWLNTRSSGVFKVIWISNTPQATEVAFFKPDGTKRIVDMNTLDIKENERHSHYMVVYDAYVLSQAYSEHPDLWAEVVAGEYTQAALASNAVVVSNRVAIRVEEGQGHKGTQKGGKRGKQKGHH